MPCIIATMEALALLLPIRSSLLVVENSPQTRFGDCTLVKDNRGNGRADEKRLSVVFVLVVVRRGVETHWDTNRKYGESETDGLAIGIHEGFSVGLCI